MTDLSTLSGQIYECLLWYPETRVGGKVFFQKFMEIYYPERDFSTLPFDVQSIGRLQRNEQKKDRDSGENKIQPPKDIKLKHAHKEMMSHTTYRRPRNFDSQGNPTLSPISPPPYAQESRY